MDVGAFVLQGTDNAYFGMKTETGANNDRQDAVISWGDNYLPTNVIGQTTGIDKLRVIFTSPTTGQLGAGPGAMSTADGLEFVRYVPFHNASLGVNDPRTGFGDFQNLLPVGTINPGNTIEINSIMNGFNAVANTNVTGSYVGSTGASGLRFRDLTSQSAIVPITETAVNHTKALSVDNLGNVVLIDNGAGGNFGVDCGSSNAGLLPNDWRIGMNGHSVNFVGTGNVNIGDLNNCLPGSTSSARLWVRNSFGSPNPTTGIRVDNVGGAGTYAGYFSNGDLFCTGAVFGSSSSTFSDKNIKTNINTIVNSMEVINKLRAVSYKYDNTYAPQLTLDGNTNYGFIAQEVAAIVPELVKTTTVFSGYDSLGNAVGADVSLKALNYDAIIPFAVGAIQELNAKQKVMQASLDKADLSDAQVKTNISSFNALSKIKTLNPVQYNFTNTNVPQLTFKSNLDYGFVAQQLETVYPELVDTLRIDATYDSLGVVVTIKF